MAIREAYPWTRHLGGGCQTAVRVNLVSVARFRVNLVSMTRFRVNL